MSIEKCNAFSTTMQRRAMKQLSVEVDEGILAISTDSGIMNKIKDEVTEGLLETSGNFKETIKTIKDEVDDEADIKFTNDVPMQLFGYGSDANSYDIDDTYVEYEIVMKLEPELEMKSDELQNELTDELNPNQKHSCSQCDFVTSRKYYLDIHNEMVHSRGENTDPLEPSTNSSLMRHFKAHSKDEHSIKSTERDHKTVQYDSLKDQTKTHFKQALKASGID
ncbi:hypothetical protein HA402_008963 [Bradysia odoriphaga]|nr:hypothetical protein HA402_008963 [Bradysia odoriphaga]